MIISGITNQAKQDFRDGIHRADDVYKFALYEADANLNKSTLIYSPVCEVDGEGYVAGGIVLVGRIAGLDQDVAWVSWKDPLWDEATMTARGGLVYNSTRGNKAVAVLDFGKNVTSTNDRYLVRLPPANGRQAIIRIGP